MSRFYPRKRTGPCLLPSFFFFPPKELLMECEKRTLLKVYILLPTKTNTTWGWRATCFSLRQVYLNPHIKDELSSSKRPREEALCALVSIRLPDIFGTLPSKLPSEPASNSFRCLHWHQTSILWEFLILKAD